MKNTIGLKQVVVLCAGGIMTAAAQAQEACCLPDGNCVFVSHDECLDAWSGTPMGVGTDCDTVECVADFEPCCLPDGGCALMPAGECEPGGFIPPGGMCLGDNDGNQVDDACESSDYLFEFSVDIGGDTELSDPFMDGDEGFDPGDVYWWQGPPVNPPGRDGFKDDAFIFTFDPLPDPPDATGSTRVPVGEGGIEMYFDFFDLDGHDQLDIDLMESQLIPPRAPVEMPVLWFETFCIYPPEFLMVSMDDDMAEGWPVADVPVTRPSPAGVSSYGTTGARDEVFGVNLMAGGPPPYPPMAVYPIADEVTVHQSLRPNPDGREEDDDDVDSLDIVESQDSCPFWYFSADHEAHFQLDPGDIYQVTGFGPIPVVDDVIHLGLPDETDVDAFEFAWVEHPDQPGMPFLSVVFSVDEDDLLTPWDESGGQDPTVLYVSWFQGWFMPLSEPLGDDIDAVTAWREPLEETQPCQVVGAWSCQHHGAAGRLCLDLLANPIEPRQPGASDIDIDIIPTYWPVSASVNCVNNPYLGAVVVNPTASGINVQFAPPLPDQDACVIQLDCGDRVCVRTLAGDVDRNGLVTTSDASAVKAVFGQPATVAPAADYDVNGVVSTADFSALKSLFGHSAPTCP